MPTSLVVKNGSNARAWVSASMPAPVSMTAIDRYSPGFDLLGESRDVGGVERAIGGLDDETAAARHRVPRVEREIDQRVFELIGIDEGVPDVVGEDRPEHDLLAERPLQEIADAGDQGVGVDRLRSERLPAGERKKPRGQRAGALDALQRQVFRPFDPRPGWSLRQKGELSVDGVEAAEHEGQEIVEVVCDAAGELAERLHLLRLAQLFLEPPPFRDVAGADHHPTRLAFAGRDRCRDGFDRAAFLNALVAIGALLCAGTP